MNPSSPPLALVVIAGPQASGKTAVARALSDELRSEGERVALVELDQIAAMTLPTLPSWETAHAIFESVTGQWARAGLTCVVAEGSGTGAEASRVLRQAPENAVAITVVTTVPFDVALARAQSDLTRGVSRQPAFLRGVYQRWASELAWIDADVLLDTGTLSVSESVQRVRHALAVARRATPPAH